MMFATRRFSHAVLQQTLRHQTVTHAPAATAAIAGRFKSTDAGSSSSSTALIINAVGQDRLGIVSDITGMVIENGGNVSDSQAAKLGSYFSLMMMVHVPTGTGQLDSLKKQLSSMSDMKVSIFETPASDKASLLKKTPQIAYSGKFTLEGADHPGIVHKLTTALAQHGLSVDKMETDQDIAPHGGTVLFRMRGIAQAAAPLCKTFDAARIGQQLRRLGDDLNCTVDLIDITHDTYEASFVAG